MFLEDTVKVNIKTPYKRVLFRINEHEAAYEMFYNEEDFKEFLEMLNRNGYPMSVQELIDSSISSDWICFGCDIDWDKE